MKKLEKEERKRRGCAFCESIKSAFYCPHDECPYHELDGYKSYQEYIEATKEEWIRLIQKVRFYDDT